MSKGENIFKRKDGRWEARYILDKNREPSWFPVFHIHIPIHSLTP